MLLSKICCLLLSLSIVIYCTNRFFPLGYIRRTGTPKKMNRWLKPWHHHNLQPSPFFWPRHISYFIGCWRWTLSLRSKCPSAEFSFFHLAQCNSAFAVSRCIVISLDTTRLERNLKPLRILATFWIDSNRITCLSVSKLLRLHPVESVSPAPVLLVSARASEQLQ